MDFSRFLAFGSSVICAPFSKITEEKVAGHRGLALVQEYLQLAPLVVLAAGRDAGVKAGDVVYVRGENVTQVWAKPVVLRRLDGEKSQPFIVVPTNQVLIVEAGPAEFLARPAPTSIPGPGMVTTCG